PLASDAVALPLAISSGTPLPTPATVVAWFERTAQEQAARIAISSGQTHLTYSELNARANQLARALRARGVQAEDRIGICLERGPELLIAMLGVLKAGAAYVPLDPAYPPQRLAYLVEDAASHLVITQGETAMN